MTGNVRDWRRQQWTGRTTETIDRESKTGGDSEGLGRLLRPLRPEEITEHSGGLGKTAGTGETTQTMVEASKDCGRLGCTGETTKSLGE